MTAPFCLLATCCLAPGGTLLGVAGERFTLQGQPAFLLGCSYYGGLAAEPAAVAADLDDLRRHGFNWLRLRGFTRDWEPTIEDFLADLTGAREGGAAGWCFHNGDQRADPAGRPRRSFDLRPAEGRLWDQLDPVERAFLARLRESFAAAP